MNSAENSDGFDVSADFHQPEAAGQQEKLLFIFLLFKL